MSYIFFPVEIQYLFFRQSNEFVSVPRVVHLQGLAVNYYLYQVKD